MSAAWPVVVVPQGQSVGDDGRALRSQRQSDADFNRQRDATILKHGADPADICGAVRYLLEAEAVTGQMLAVDGGQHLIWQTPDVQGGE